MSTANVSIRFCKRCLYSSAHPLGLVLDQQGICSGCRVHEEKNWIDWRERFASLKSLVNSYRSSSSNNYDCIVPVSGGGDSFFIVHTVKNILGLNPLLVSYNKYWNTEVGIHNLAILRNAFNCDALIQNVNPISVKKIVRDTLSQTGSIYWHCIAGQTAFPVQIAVLHKIPLIIWGAHQGTEQVGMFSHLHEVEMSRRYRKDHDLCGREADDLITTSGSLVEEDIVQYRYPCDSDLNDIGARGIYLSNFIRWDPISQHEDMIHRYGYCTARFDRTFDCYDYVDCHNYMGIHDMLKLYKHGYSKVTDHACREIRHGRITRMQALALVRHYEQRASGCFPLFAHWLGCNPSSLQWVLDSHRSCHYWTEVGYRKWSFNGLSMMQGFCNKDHSQIEIEPIQNQKVFANTPARYITFGKGYP